MPPSLTIAERECEEFFLSALGVGAQKYEPTSGRALNAVDVELDFSDERKLDEVERHRRIETTLARCAGRSVLTCAFTPNPLRRGFHLERFMMNLSRSETETLRADAEVGGGLGNLLLDGLRKTDLHQKAFEEKRRVGMRRLMLLDLTAPAAEAWRLEGAKDLAKARYLPPVDVYALYDRFAERALAGELSSRRRLGAVERAADAMLSTALLSYLEVRGPVLREFAQVKRDRSDLKFQRAMANGSR